MLLNIKFGCHTVKLLRLLEGRLKEANAQPTEISLQLPQVPVHNVSVYWLPYSADWHPEHPQPPEGVPAALGFWAHFPGPNEGRHGLNCRFGSTLSMNTAAVRPSVQIVLPLDTQGLRKRGRTLMDEEGNLHLGHRGGLGGGGNGIVTIQQFTRHMMQWGITPRPAQGPEDAARTQDVFVIGKPSDEDFLLNLGRYINCCYVLKQMGRLGLL